jgi:hypothetical protein
VFAPSGPHSIKPGNESCDECVQLRFDLIPRLPAFERFASRLQIVFLEFVIRVFKGFVDG